jgi:hypothetical protein
MIINRTYEHQNLLSMLLVSFLVGLRTSGTPAVTDERKQLGFFTPATSSHNGRPQTKIMGITQAFTVLPYIRLNNLKSVEQGKSIFFPALRLSLRGRTHPLTAPSPASSL